jgi:uncharacterized protein
MMRRLLSTNNPLFTLARQGKRLTNVGFAVPLAWVFVLATLIGRQAIVFVLFGENAPFDLTMFMVVLSLTIIPVLLVALWLQFYEERPFWTVGFIRRGALSRFIQGIVIGILMFSFSVGIVALFGGVVTTTASAASGIAALGGVLLVLFGWIIQASSEEILFRGWLFQTVGARHTPFMGLIVSSLLFSLAHAFNDDVTLVALVNLALNAIFLALYALREGSLWGVCGIHIAWNWVQGNIFGLAVSGNAPPGGSLFDLQMNPVSSDLITGGSFGPEGSVLVSVVLIISSLFVIFAAKPSQT